MSAKTLTASEIEIVLNHLSQKKHSSRNRLLIMMNHYLDQIIATDIEQQKKQAIESIKF